MTQAGVENFFSRRPIFGRSSEIAHPFGYAKNGRSKLKYTFDQDNTRNIALCSLLPK